MMRHVNQVMAKFKVAHTDQLIVKEAKRTNPNAGLALQEKLAPQNTMTYPKDIKTAKHRMSFLNFMPKTKTPDLTA